jgi:hypothetical protein
MLALLLLTFASAPDPTLGDKLEKLAHANVFIAHQRVGQSILDGASAIAAQHFVKLKLDHALVGKDGAPLTKLKDFEAQLQARAANPPSVAMLELSYADLTADTDVDALFAAYKQAHDTLKARYPNTRFVIATAGLTSVGRGLQGMLKNKMASGAFGERENVKRHQFNELLRKTYADTRLFDLAALQSRGCTFTREGKLYPCLREELTDDGGNLNTLGRKEAGRALIDALQ